jgi:DNA-binding transcriptional LysR family regulator
MRNLNLDQLQALVEVVELGSISAAAKRLNLTQPAVSLQIRELESRLGMPLLRRAGRKATPTSAGRALADQAQEIFETTRRALTVVRRHRDGSLGRVRIGVGNAALRYFLLPVLQRLRREHPAIELAVSTGNTFDVADRLTRNMIDLGFTGLPVDGGLFESAYVSDMKLVAILPARGVDLPPVVTPHDIEGWPLITMPLHSNLAQLARGWLQAGGVEMRPAMEIDSVDAIQQVVVAGLGVALVPEVALSRCEPVDGLASRPLDPPLALRLGLIRRRNAPDDPALVIVRNAIMTLAEAESADGAIASPAVYAAVSHTLATSPANRISP